MAIPIQLNKEPELIAWVDAIDKKGDSYSVGSCIVGVSVVADVDDGRGVVKLDVREFDKRMANVVIHLPLEELVAAITRATFNRG